MADDPNNNGNNTPGDNKNQNNNSSQNNNNGQPNNNNNNGGGNDNSNKNTKTEDELRAESAAYRVKAREEKEAREKAEKDKKDAEEKAQKAIEEEKGKYAEKEGKYKSRLIDTELRSLATSEGINDLDLLKLIDKADIKIDDEGNVTGADEAIKKFKESKPHFFKDAGGKGGKGGDKNEGGNKSTGSKQAPPNPDPNPAPKDVRKMSKEEYNAAKKQEMAKLKRSA